MELRTMSALSETLPKATPGGRMCAQAFDRGLDSIGDLDGVCARLLAHGEDDAALSVDPEGAFVVAGTVQDVGYLAEAQRELIAISDDEVRELIGGGELAVRLQGVVSRVTIECAGGKACAVCW
jgi:hypothetical protein